jgi:steroid delta-isomerase-like uncharacterized protein
MEPLVQRFVDAYNSRALDAFDSLLTDDVILIRNEEEACGRDAFKAVVAKLWRAFPDIQYSIEDAIVSGNKMALRWQGRGTHKGEYLGVQGSGRPISYGVLAMYELRDGRIARAWYVADLYSLLRRLQEGKVAAAAEARA